MARRALCVVNSVPLFQIRVVVMASSASKMCVLGIVAPAVEQAIRLKTYVVDATEVGHHGHGVRAAMASRAELLRKTFGIECFRIENVRALSGGEEPVRSGSLRSVAGLAGHAGGLTDPTEVWC